MSSAHRSEIGQAIALGQRHRQPDGLQHALVAAIPLPPDISI
jgi:hypothetical protein